MLLAAASGLIALAVALSSLATAVLGPDSWLDALDASQAYQRAPAAIAEQLTVVGGPAQAAPLAPLDRVDIEALVAAVAPPDWLREQARLVLPPLIRRAATTGNLGGVISLEPLKVRLSGPALGAAALARVQAWPTCGVAELQELTSGRLVRCGPPPDLQDELAAATTALFAAVAASLPVEVDLETVLRDSSSAGLAGPIRAVASASSVVDTLIPLVLVVLAAATVVAGLSLRSALRAWAVPLVVSGLLLLALAALAVPLLGGAGETLRRAIADDGGAPELADIGGSMAMAMASQLGAQLVQVAVVLLAGGTLLAAARWVLGRS